MQITYLFDPLCGWCYGAEPAIELLIQLDDITVDFVPTGLFAGEGARVMDPSFAAYAWQNDERIARLTGQVFSDLYRTRILGKAGTMFDSAPATLGFVAAQLTAPARQAEALKVLQRARYIDGRDNSDRETVADILSEAGFTDAAKRVRVPDDELLLAYRRRIETARADMARFGAHGVPTLILGEGASRRMVPGNVLFSGVEALIRDMHAVSLT